MECPNVHTISPQVVALFFYANKCLLTANEHYEWIPTWCCEQLYETEEWEDYLIQAIISANSAKSYAATLSNIYDL